MLYRFHVNLFVKPSTAQSRAEIDLHGLRVTPLCGPNGAALIYEEPLPVTFETALEALLNIPRLDAEPDGFFVLAGGSGPTHWRVSGHLYDFNNRLHRVELHGECPPESFDALLSCIDWPKTQLMFELVEQGVALNETDFRFWASRAVPGPGV